jgi:hypothetical protein
MALRSADHALDQDFATAIRNAAFDRQSLSGHALDISNRIDELLKKTKEDETSIADLEKQGTPAPDQNVVHERQLIASSISARQ